MKQSLMAVVICISVIAGGRNVSEAMQVMELGRGEIILRRAAAAIKKVEPAWHFRSGICDCNPVLDEVDAVVGHWEHKPDGVAVGIQISKSVDSASRWMNQAGRRDRMLRNPDWSFTRYELADGSYLGSYRNGEWYDLTFRKGRVIAGLVSKSKPDIERFAQYILAAISEVE